MLGRGKFPLKFEPSEGVAQVRSLIEAVRESEKKAEEQRVRGAEEAEELQGQSKI
jgi:hypothetical protein